jgi:protein gp37
MADKSSIEWTDATWNPIVGCSIVSPGCTNCYAMKMAARIEAMGNAHHYDGTTKSSKAGAVWTGKLALAPEKTLLAPLRWKEPRRIFVNSMGDLFHEDAPDEWIDRVFAVMALAPQHTFQVLTKRAHRMRDYLIARNGMGNSALCDAINEIPARMGNRRGALEMPLPNVWLGVSTERQQEAEERIPLLLETPAAVRFISAEPLLGAINLRRFLTGHEENGIDLSREAGSMIGGCIGWTPPLDWIIVGGESGPGARSMQIEWAADILDQCRKADIACFMKQLGARPRKNVTTTDGEYIKTVDVKMADRAGGDIQEWPGAMRVREFPEAHA